MGSVYANIVNKIREGNDSPGPGSYTYPLKISDIEESDPFYFVAKDTSQGYKIVAEGDLAHMKLMLPDRYFDMRIKSFYRDKNTQIAYVEF
jgi:hypothetical protein